MSGSGNPTILKGNPPGLAVRRTRSQLRNFNNMEHKEYEMTKRQVRLSRRDTEDETGGTQVRQLRARDNCNETSTSQVRLSGVRHKEDEISRHQIRQSRVRGKQDMTKRSRGRQSRVKDKEDETSIIRIRQSRVREEQYETGRSRMRQSRARNNEEKTTCPEVRRQSRARDNEEKTICPEVRRQSRARDNGVGTTKTRIRQSRVMITEYETTCGRVNESRVRKTGDETRRTPVKKTRMSNKNDWTPGQASSKKNVGKRKDRKRKHSEQHSKLVKQTKTHIEEDTVADTEYQTSDKTSRQHEGIQTLQKEEEKKRIISPEEYVPGEKRKKLNMTDSHIQMNVTGASGGHVKTAITAGIVNNIGGGFNTTLVQNISKTIYEGQKGKELSRADKIMKRTVSQFQSWNQGMVKTAALGQVLDKLNSGTSWLTIKGNPGEGKTTVGYMALEELHRCGRQVFQVRSPDEFTEVISTCSRPVIMLDDVFGNLEFDITKWSNWEPDVSPLLKEREHKSHEEENKTSKKDVTVILIGRDYVLNPASVDLGRLSVFLTSDKHVVYMDHSVKRSIEEKRAIWESISRSSCVELDKTIVDEILKIEVPHGFPHVCHLFTTIYKENKAIDVVKFFSKPLEFLNESISNLFKDTNKLMLFREMVKGDGKISKREIRKLDPTLKITQTADSLVGTYIKVEEDSFVFDHPSIYDSVAFHMCSLDPEFVIQQCHVSFIHERVRILFSQDVTLINNSESSLVVYVNRSYADALAERLASEIMAQNFVHVLSHQAFTDKTFVSKIMSRMKTYLQSLLRLHDREYLTHYFTFLSLIPSSTSPALLKYIDKCPDITLSTEDEKHILYGTCRYAASEVLTYLINTRQSLDINVRYSFGKTPLMIAAETIDVHFVHNILSLSPDLNARDDMNRTISHYLSEYGLVSVMTQIIDSGIDIDVQDWNGESPLCYACRYNQLEVVKLLIERGASVDETSLHEACRGGNIQIVELLFKTGKNLSTKDILNSSLSAASEGGNVDIMNLLVNKGASVNQSDSRLFPLQAACRYRQTQHIRWLLQQGADVDSRDWRGDTALHTAAEAGSGECVEILLTAGATVNIQDKEGNTALNRAAWWRSGECVEILLKAGATVNILNKEGDTPLHSAFRPYVCIPNISTCQALIQQGASVNTQNTEGNTPLHCLCLFYASLINFKRNKFTDLALMLIDRGADVHILNKQGQQALHGMLHNMLQWMKLSEKRENL